ncbi:hypothetical protein GGF31_003107 [Allomyces arbusculus]|nr:hypothetical protein GGF31_003107 [Allomyces arbusculus]
MITSSIRAAAVAASSWPRLAHRAAAPAQHARRAYCSPRMPAQMDVSRNTTPAATSNAVSITMHPAADLHVHLRQGPMAATVVPKLVGTGIDTFVVMPNLIPPISDTDMAIAYQKDLYQWAGEGGKDLKFLMTIYLSPELTPDEVRKAKRMGITGIKSYPRGVTTNSDSGIESYDAYYPVFKAMEEEGMILNLHGECPSNPEQNITVLNAEARFLTHLEKLHRDFPKLRIVLEHVTTKDAVDLVASMGPTVACTVTVHHLYLTVEDWAGLPHGFCKPVAKTFADRTALREIVRSGHPRFFLGTDSAPHPRHAKESARAPAGLFTSMHPLPYLAHLFHQLDMLPRLPEFACKYGREFYGLALPETGSVTLTHVPVEEGITIPEVIMVEGMVGPNGAPVEVVPFLAGQTLPWKITVSS